MKHRGQEYVLKVMRKKELHDLNVEQFAID